MRWEQIPARDRTLLMRAGLVTVRDTAARRLLEPVERLALLPCPALFAAMDRMCPRERPRRLRIALSGQCPRGAGDFQTVPAAVYNYSLELFEALMRHFDCEFIAHYVDEVCHFRTVLGGRIPIRYSYDPSEYAAMFEEFDLLVTTRVHGAGLAASMGVPGVVIGHSARSETVKGFLSAIVRPGADTVESVVERIRKVDVAAANTALRKHQEKCYASYQAWLAPFLEQAGLLT